MNESVLDDEHFESAPGRLRPSFSVVLPVHDPALADLERAVASVEASVWPGLELCLVDDGSRRPEIRAYLDSLASRAGVRFARHETARGIAGATNAAIELASGEYLLFLDHDDELAEGAIEQLVRVLREAPDTDLLYSDHDRIDVDGRRLGIDRKPGWSPELLLSYMYIGHLKLVRTSLVRALGGYREGFEGAADYDFALRLAEAQPKVLHVPRVLYHWRAAERSIARDAQVKQYAFESGRRALQAALERRRIPARAEWPGWARRAGIGVFRMRFEAPSAASVGVVILSRGDERRRRECIASLERSDGGRSRTVVVADASRPGDALCDVVRSLDAELVAFLDERLLVATPGWLDELSGFASLEGVGAVGAKLVGEDGRIRHAGTVLGIDGGAGSAFEGRPDVHWPLEHGCYAHTPRDCSGVSMRAMAIRRELFLELGGFDDRFAGEGQCDTDLCLRLQDKGLRIVLNPYAEALLPADAEADWSPPVTCAPLLRGRWAERLCHDAYYHPAFTRRRADFTPRTTRCETASDGRPLPVLEGELDALDLHELVQAQEQRIAELEARLAGFEGLARLLARLASHPLARRLRRSWLGARLRRALDGTRLERRLKALLGHAQR